MAKKKSHRPIRQAKAGSVTPAATDSASSRVPIVGIGASAGGLDALKKLFSNMPADNGLAFVLVPHLDPSHESLMVELLGKQTGMPVEEAADLMQVQSSHVYIIPPNQCLTVADGMLHLSPLPDDRVPYGTMDTFLCSLAEDRKEQAIGIVLSGTGQHGVQGLQAIGAAGGMVIAQRPDTAAYPSMPRAAVDAGVADFVLPPEEMPDALISYVQHDYVKNGTIEHTDTDTQTKQLHRILALLRTHTRYDFRSYRKKMLMRRVERRMSLSHIDAAASYIELLRKQPDERKRLVQDLLIGVTEFFREPEAFDVLAQQAFPELIQRASADVALRVWVPGCASGEEAYSVAMLLTEQFNAVGRHANLQIFATDIDEQALDRARRGIYSDNAVRNVSAERRRKFFVKSGEQQYQVSKQLRESLVFAPQNLVSDAPFSKLDLITCRNLLIYLEPDAQARAISLFHFALNPGGYLVLGPSETIGRRTDLFETVSKKWRVFRRLETAVRRPVDFPMLPTTEQQRLPAFATDVAPVGAADLDRLTERLLLRGAPAAVLINRRHEILNYHGPTRQYLENPDGPPQHDLMRLALEGLRAKLRTAVLEAVRRDVAVVVEDARVKRDGAYHSVRFTVEPLQEAKAEGLLLVTFEDRDISPPRQQRTDEPSLPRKRSVEREVTEDSTLVSQLEFELKATREDLQSTIEEQDSSNEELKAANEEVMSMNEELQSANEELESSKEELQSLNEELATVNNQLESKVEELETANSLVTNLLRSTEYATVFLDRAFQIKVFTSPAGQLFSLRSSDVGRPLSEITSRITDPDLLGDCQTVLDKLTSIEREVWTDESNHQASRDGDSPRCYLRRVLPFRTVDDRIDGVVITLMNITDRKLAEQVTHEARLYAEAIVATVREPLIVLDANLRMKSANAAFYREFQVTMDESRDRLLFELGNHQWDIPELRTLLEEMLPQDKQVNDYRVVHEFERIGRRTMLLNARKVRVVEEQPDAILLAIEDITEREQAEDALRELNEQLEQRVTDQTSEIRLLAEAISHLGEGVLITDDELDWPGPLIRFVNDAMCRISGYAAEELIGQSPGILQGEETSEETRAHIRRELEAHRSCSVELTNYRKDGTPYDAELFITPLFDAAGRRTNFVSIHRDITEQKHVGRALREREERLRAILNTASEAIVNIDRCGVITDINPATKKLFGYTEDELVGQNVRILMPSPYHDKHDGYIARYLETGKARMIGIGREVTGRHKDGSAFPIELAVSEVDHLGLFTGIIRDISVRRRLEREVLNIASAEQRRIGQDLHDDLGQQLTGLGIMADTLMTTLQREGRPDAELKLSRGLRDDLKLAVEFVRTLARGLVPVEVATDGLPVAFASLAERIQGLNQVACDFDCPDDVTFRDSNTPTHLYHIAQEALANAVRHAAPRKLRLSLRLIDQTQTGSDVTPGEVCLTIQDDGCGFDTSSSSRKTPGVGIQTMNYRAGQIGANLTIQSEPGTGTTVTCTVPLMR
jgi:two-component system CheB/CheR fusion protein